jgi:hypothetical protein
VTSDNVDEKALTLAIPTLAITVKLIPKDTKI